MQKGMFLSFWIRTKNDYFNVKSELTEKSVFTRQIKTEFIQGQDELISGRVSYTPNTLCYVDTSDYNRVRRSSSQFNDWVHVFMDELFLQAQKVIEVGQWHTNGMMPFEFEILRHKILTVHFSLYSSAQNS